MEMLSLRPIFINRVEPANAQFAFVMQPQSEPRSLTGAGQGHPLRVATKAEDAWGDDADGLIPKGYQAQTEVVVARLKVKMERLFPILRTLKSIA